VTQVASTTRVVVAATATATALVVGVVGIVLAVDDRRRSGSTITSPSPSGEAPSATQLAPMPTPTVSRPAPLLLPNMRSLSASDLQIEVVGTTRRLRFAASLANVGPGPLFCCLGVAAVAPAASMRPFKYCTEMPTETASFSEPATVRKAVG
jgi:hypothetical protein